MFAECLHENSNFRFRSDICSSFNFLAVSQLLVKLNVCTVSPPALTEHPKPALTHGGQLPENNRFQNFQPFFRSKKYIFFQKFSTFLEKFSSFFVFQKKFKICAPKFENFPTLHKNSKSSSSAILLTLCTKKWKPYFGIEFKAS